MAKKTTKKTAAEVPSWYQECLNNIAKIPGGTLCSEQHCADARQQNKMICTCQPPYMNGCTGPSPKPGCCSYSASSPVYVWLPGGGCYCCCGGAMAAMEVAVSKNSSIAADQLKKGDTVYAPKDTSLREWVSVPLQFASFNAATEDNPQVNIQLSGGKGKTQTIVAGAKQLMMLPDKKFKEARKLAPGIDQLVNNEGKAADIIAVNTGAYTAFTAYLSTTAAPAANPAGHLLSLNGFITGDYALSLGIAAEHLAEGHEQLPVAGTTAYKERYPHLG